MDFAIFVGFSILFFSASEATVEAEMMYMLQPSRLYVGDNINVFEKGRFETSSFFQLFTECCCFPR